MLNNFLSNFTFCPRLQTVCLSLKPHVQLASNKPLDKISCHASKSLYTVVSCSQSLSLAISEVDTNFCEPLPTLTPENPVRNAECRPGNPEIFVVQCRDNTECRALVQHPDRSVVQCRWEVNRIYVYVTTNAKGLVRKWNLARIGHNLITTVYKSPVFGLSICYGLSEHDLTQMGS